MSSARDEILNKVSNSLSHNTHIPDVSTHYMETLKLENIDLYENYKINQINNKAIVIETEKGELASQINTILLENESQDVLCNLDIELDTSLIDSSNVILYNNSVDEIRDLLFKIDTSIVQARCGVADLGIVALSSHADAPRLSSLITNTCIYLLDKRNIVQHLFAAIEFVEKYEKERTQQEILPSNIIFVAGPSRTADIELQTVFGVHGPRKTYVLLY